MGPNQQYTGYTPPPNYGGGNKSKSITIDKQLFLYIGLGLLLIVAVIIFILSLGSKPATAALDRTIAKEQELLRINDIVETNIRSEYDAAIIHSNSVAMTETSLRKLNEYRAEITELKTLDPVIVAENTSETLDAEFEEALSVNRLKQVYKSTMEKQLTGNLANHNNLLASTNDEKLQNILAQTIVNEKDLLKQVQKL